MTIFGVPSSSTRQYTGMPASAYMAGLTAQSIDTVGGRQPRPPRSPGGTRAMSMVCVSSW